MAGCAGSLFAENSDAMSVIDHNGGAVLLCDSAELGQLDNIPFHAEYAVDDDEFAGLGLQLLKAGFQGDQIFVRETEKLALSEQATFNDAGMVALVTDH